MAVIAMTSEFAALGKVDWEFSDYSSALFKADINSIHWYPGSFVPQIPSILIGLLSNAGDTVLDPFAGSGIALVEAARLGRKYIGVDVNPFAMKIAQAKFDSVIHCDTDWFTKEEDQIKCLQPLDDHEAYCDTMGIDLEVNQWFEIGTLRSLLALHRHVCEERNDTLANIKQVIFSSILNRCSSQREHYTYITDRCFPKQLITRPAKELYLTQLSLLSLAVDEMRSQFKRLHQSEWETCVQGSVRVGDSRNLSFISPASIDLVVTSPPYLGVNDYVRSLRLTYMFLPHYGDDTALMLEIGARRKRFRKTALSEYLDEMGGVFQEIKRVLKPSGFMCLVIGEGRGKVNLGGPLVSILEQLNTKYEFTMCYETERRIKFRRIQVPGVGHEKIIILRLDS